MNYEIKRFLEEREIESLYHFTPVENLESILKNGLLSRNSLSQKRLDFIGTDPNRFDGILDGVCTSIEFPNYKMFFKFRNAQKYYEDSNVSGNWCVIELDASILAEKNCLFYANNAASREEANVYYLDKIGIAGLRRMFGQSEVRELIGTKAKFPTNPQAEVQVLEDIEPSYIKAVHFNDNVVRYYLDKEFRNIYNKKSIDFLLTDSLFEPREDYRYWPSKRY